jgi:biopolymer transport protein ExbD
MKSQIERISDEECELEMTSMIDVTFLLLIFFMCTLKFKTLEGKLAAYLPKDVGVNSSDDPPIEKVEVTLRVLNEGNKIEPKREDTDPDIPWDGEPGTRYIYDATRRVEYAIGPRRTRDLEEVSRVLSQLHEADTERPATIDARKGIVYEDVVKVLDAAILAKFDEVTFVGAYE